MKKRNWICLILIVLCLAAFFGYRLLDQMQSDTKVPQISMDTQTPQVSVFDSSEALFQGMTAKDDKDGDVTSSLVVESITLVNADGTVAVSYAAFDKAGNVAKAQREVFYTDYESPKFSLTTPLISTVGTNVDVLGWVGATDIFDGDIRHRVRATPLDSTSISTQGIHNVEFRVTNSLGDTARIVLPVEVCSADVYNARLTLTDYLIYLPVGSAFEPKSYLEEYTLAGETTILGARLPEDITLKVEGQVNTQVPGVYPVSYTVSKTRGTAIYTGYSKLIVVVEG